jgi:GTP-binding protein
MIITSVTFVCSSPDLKACPAPVLPEYAFIGRSNVGKSSLINMLTGQKNLARTSSRPGKTRIIQHYLINGQWYMADLPGFGYAKVPMALRQNWQQSARHYLIRRTNLLNIFVLIDCRLDPQQIDLDLVNWLGENQLPFTILFTKTDKLSVLKANRKIEDFKQQMLLMWEELPVMISTSSVTGKGKEEILAYIEEANRIFEK